jgi:pyruvate-ferredoxin/flavodoxin oxidoreductase
VRSSFYDSEIKPVIVGGRFGLGSKDTTPADIKAVFDNLKSDSPKNHFTVGITDDVTHTSLTVDKKFRIPLQGSFQCVFFGIGSDGTVGANKQAVKLIGEHTDKFVQAYFSYDSKKSGGLTVSHLRFSDKPIRAEYLVQEADYVACHIPQPFGTFSVNILKYAKDNAILMLNSCVDELETHLSDEFKREAAHKKLRVYCIDAAKIAEKIGLGNRINMIMLCAFFAVTAILPKEEAKKYLKQAVKKSYAKYGKDIEEKNYSAIDIGFEEVKRVDFSLLEKYQNDICDKKTEEQKADEPEFVTQIMRPMQQGQGDDLPVSTFTGMEDGTFPVGTTAYEKRGIGVRVPEWIPKNCIQCNQCSFICPHACIRPFLLTEEEEKSAPKDFETKKAAGMMQMYFRIQVSPMDCTGCGNCADICPSKEKALVMKDFHTQREKQIENWAYAVESVGEKPVNIQRETVKGSQFYRPLLEFSGACAGCGETAYIKLVTQLFGERMMIANATGCSSIWSASAPSMAYTCNSEGKGPAWANSLFEDNAEYGYGMYLGVQQEKRNLENAVKMLAESDIDEKLKQALIFWLEVKENAKESQAAAAEIIKKIHETDKSILAESDRLLLEKIIGLKDYLVKRSQWIVGGDGWAYDIGFGGLDHVLASGEDINVLVFDTEVYSNTGGQASKATHRYAGAKFALDGKKTEKKNLGKMMMTYGNVYVAQIAMGADKNQTVKAITEAQKYNGPSLIIAYAPCISHGIKKGMGKSMANMKEAVETGYWQLYRYNPMLKKEGKNPFIQDSKEPTKEITEFYRGQVRFSNYPDKQG